MRSSLFPWAILLVGMCWSGPMIIADGPKTRVEIRRAEKSPGKGLTGATVVGSKEKVYLHKEAVMTNQDLARAELDEDATGRPAIQLYLTKEGAAKMEKLTGSHMDKPLGFLVDDRLFAAPTVRARISDKAFFTGGFSKQEAERIVKAINGK
jgi:preprotein translocase subunit SecD